MSEKYPIGVRNLFSAPSMDTPLSEWIWHGLSKGNVVEKMRPGYLSYGTADQSGLTPRAESIKKVASVQLGFDLTLLNHDIDEILSAIPTGAILTDSAKKALGVSNPSAIITPRAFALVPEADVNEDTPGSWYKSENLSFIEKGLLHITGDFNGNLGDGEDNLEGYDVSVMPFVSGLFTGGKGLYRAFYEEVLVGDNPLYIEVNADNTQAYVANIADDTISFIDLISLEVTDVVAVPGEINDMKITPDGTKLLCSNLGSSDTVSIIDIATATVDDNVSVGNNPDKLTINSISTKAAVTNRDSDTVSIIDIVTATVDDNVSVADKPRSIAFSKDDTKLVVGVYGGTAQNVSVIDVATATVDGTETVSNSINSVYTTTGGKALCVIPENDAVLIVDISTQSIDATLNVGDNPLSGEIDGVEAFFYVCNRDGNSVTKIDISGQSVEATIPVGVSPYDLAVYNENKIYVSNINDDSISVIDYDSNLVIQTISTGDNPSNIKVSSDGLSKFIVVRADDKLQIVRSS